MAKIAFAFTVCATAEAGKIAVKRFTPTETIGYGRVTWWRFQPVIETSHEAMAERLKALALQPQKMIVMGAPAFHLDLSQAHRRLWADAGTATLIGPDRGWLPIDFDDVVVPKGLGRGEQLAEAALFVRDRLLPAEFHGVRMIAVPSASTGRKGDCIARLRLFVALASPHSLAAMKQWVKGAAAALDQPIDSSPVQSGQPLYTGRPVFDGVSDPVPRALHAVILPGDCDLVTLVVDRFAPKLMKIEAKLDHVARSCGSDWRALMNETVGGDEGYFTPLTKAIGVAVRTGASADEIEAMVTTLVGLRADPDRRKHYSRAWTLRTIMSFQRRDDATRAAHKRALARLFISKETHAP